MRRSGPERTGITGWLSPVPYRLRWRPAGVHPGAHAGLGEGGNGEFRRHVPLLQLPDPRRIDLRRTIADPTGGIQVRQYARRNAVTVAALVDLSGSMAFEGRVARKSVVAELCATLALSAYRMGDRFALIGCDAQVREDVFVAPARRRGLESEVFERLVGCEPAGVSAEGLTGAADRLPTRRCLVFLVSDFLMPLAGLEAILERLWRHDVVPVVLRDAAEDDDLPRWGLVELQDLETGRRRLTVMRPALRDAWRNAGRERRAAIDRLFRQHGRSAFHVVDRLEVDALAEYLLDG